MPLSELLRQNAPKFNQHDTLKTATQKPTHEYHHISPNWTLELANASSQAKDTRIKYFRRLVLPLLSARGAE